MHDLFISYSRKDREFVHQLAGALAGLGRETWVDWEDIPPTAAFIEEIRRGIEGADSFLFVLSPDSCASATCRLEIEHAVAHRKRLIPILHRSVPTDTVAPELAPLNWVVFSDSPFDASLDSLVRAIDTDLDWVRSHTELLVQATDWERGGKSPTALLRGPELAAAERLLIEESDGRQPSLTALQREFIVASRGGAGRTLRRIIASISAALVVTIALAITAFVMYRRGLEQQRLAEHRARIADSRRLAGDSRE